MGSAAGEAAHTSIVEFTHLKPLADRFREVRACSETLCAPLAIEDYVIQTMPDVSPAKWHLAHTSWFFEAFLLGENDPHYVSPDPLYAYLFNSYYVRKGARYYRPGRGNLSRPTVGQVYDYRKHVDRAVLALIERADPEMLARIEPIIVLGLNHEQQHQELLLTDVKHVLSFNTGKPVYKTRDRVSTFPPPELRWVDFGEGLHEIGYDGSGFSYDNEGPRHRQFLEAFRLSSRPVSCGEYNGKFMCNQMVLRGGSCATSLDHIRNTYRNFFPSHSRWQFMGFRLADDQ